MSNPVRPKPKVVDTEAPAPKPKKRPSHYRRFGLPVREAKQELSMPLLQVDIDKAQEHQPDSVDDEQNFLTCVIAQAATRAWGAGRVAILRETAYVAFPGEGHTKRYLVDHASRQVLEAWDRGEPVLEGVLLRLIPPPSGKTRNAQIKRNVQWRKKHGSTDQFPGGRKTGLKRRSPDPLRGTVRNGNLVRWGSIE